MTDAEAARWGALADAVTEGSWHVQGPSVEEDDWAVYGPTRYVSTLDAMSADMFRRSYAAIAKDADERATQHRGDKP